MRRFFRPVPPTLFRAITPAYASARAGKADRRAVILAALSVVVLGTVVGVVAWRNRSTSPAVKSTPSHVVPPDIRSLPLPGSATGSVSGTTATVGPGRGFFAQFVDRDQPTRLAGEITADRSVPLADRKYELDEPRAWFFQSDGRSIHVQAAKGRVTMPPEGGQPVDGSIEGNVRIRVFAATAAGTRPDLGTAMPELDVTTTRVSVDWSLGQLDMPEEVKVTSRTVYFHGKGVTGQFDPTTQRVDQVHVASLVEPIRVNTRREPASQPAPGGSASTSADTLGAASQPATQATAASSTNAPTPPATDDQAAPEERFYALTASESVVVTQGLRKAHAESLLGWARTLDGDLVAAPKKERPAGATTGTQSHAAPANADQAPAAPISATGATASKSDTPAVSPDEVTLWWRGPLLVQRTDLRPAELARDEALVRLDSPGSVVALEDSGAGMKGEGTRLEYAVTREQIALVGGAAEQPAWVTVEGAGRATAKAFEIDIPRGIVRIPGAGSLTSIPKAEPASAEATSKPVNQEPATLAWTEKGEFVFDSLRGRKSSLKHAVMEGGVTGKQGLFSIAGDSATAEFFGSEVDSATPDVAAAPNSLRSVQLVGRASALDGAGGEFRGDTLSVAFDAPSATPADGSPAKQRTPVPRRVDAVGHAVATRDGETLTAGQIVAALRPKGPASTPTTPEATAPARAPAVSAMASQVESVDATGGFVFKGKDRAASGDTLHAETAARSAHITGAPASVEQQGSVLRCPVIDMNATDRTLTATGEGDFARTPTTTQAASGQTSIKASWTKFMSLDDTAGSLRAEGKADFAASTGLGDEREDSRVRADIVTVAFERVAAKDRPESPAKPGREGGLFGGLSPGDDRASPGDGSERRVVRAEGLSGTPTEPVRVEVVRSGAEGRLLYVEGQHIIADNTARTLTVPSAGKLLSSDRRPDLEGAALPDAGARQSQGASLPGSSKGDSLFSWKESATMEVDAGRSVMKGGVRMVHRRLADSALTELECDTLSAAITEDRGNRRLASVGALGSVWARSQGREMTADHANYDAAKGVLEAAGPEGVQGGEVLVSDPKTGEPLSARAIRWNLVTGRIEIIDPGAVTTPR